MSDRVYASEFEPCAFCANPVDQYIRSATGTVVPVCSNPAHVDMVVTPAAVAEPVYPSCKWPLEDADELLLAKGGAVYWPNVPGKNWAAELEGGQQ